MPNDVRPYFVPKPGSVRWGPWMLADEDNSTPLPDYIDGWEPGVNIRISRQLDIDRVAFEAETLTPLDACVVNVSWRSSTTDMVDSAPPITIAVADSGSVDVELVGHKLAGNLSIHSRIVLSRQPTGDTRLGAVSIPGSILDEHKQVLILENPATMFPLQMVDFARTTYAPDASWHLDVNGDLGSPFMGAVLLQINSRDAELREAISSERPNSEKAGALSDELEADVAALLIELAVANRDELLENDWSDDSVGDVLKKTLLQAGFADVLPPTANDLSDFKTRVAGAVRRTGRGRLFR